MKIITIVGARPQFIKAGPVSRAIALHNSSARTADCKIEEILVHTGQHYDHKMSSVFFETLELTTPKYNLGVGSESPGKQVAKMLASLETVLQLETPDVVVLYGDTNSTLAGALAANSMHIPIAHVEAGVRSFNRLMPEENNRILTDHVSSLLFAPTSTAVENLAKEGITAGVCLVGDVMYEAVRDNGVAAENTSQILEEWGLRRKAYSLVTVHRAENTDNPLRMEGIVGALIQVAASQTLVWPLHPRTRHKLTPSHLRRIRDCGIKLMDPVSYLDMLRLEQAANVILTDSGGVQKEAMWFGVPCVTMRDETEWIETVEGGWNKIAGSNVETILGAFREVTQFPPKPYEIDPLKPRASELIVQNIYSRYSHNIECVGVS